MGTLKVIVLILDLICAVMLTATILFQSGKSAGLSSAIAGGSDSFMAKGGTKTLDAKLAKLTKWIGLAFVILTLFAVILISATKNSASAETPETDAAVVTTEANTPATTLPVIETVEFTGEAAVTTTAAPVG